MAGDRSTSPLFLPSKNDRFLSEVKESLNNETNDGDSALVSDEENIVGCYTRADDTTFDPELDLLNQKLQKYDVAQSSRGVGPNPTIAFNKRPLNDTPIVSGTASPRAGMAMSPLDLSEDEDDTTSKHINDDNTKRNTDRNQHLEPYKMGSSSIKPAKTTLDIPGQTKSKISPDGTIVNTSERVVVVMIGLPARGKSYLSNKLVRYLNWLQINARIFNVGSTRRAKAANVGPENSPLPDKKAGTLHDASFFSPDNESNILLREEWAKETLDNLLHYLLEGDGCVGVFDATNSTKLRRKNVLDMIMEKSKGQLKVLFLESICNDRTILEDNIQLKLQGPDYRNMNPELAIKDFLGRLKNYELAYETIDEEEEKDKNFQYVKMIDVGRKVIACNIRGFLASQIIYYFLNFNLSPRQIFITRHGESEDNVKGRIGGDSNLTPRGHAFAKALAKFMDFKKRQFRETQLKGFSVRNASLVSGSQLKKSAPEEPSFSVFTSMLRRSVQTAKYFSDDFYDIKEMRMLDELGSGKFDGMTYEEIQKRFPEEFKSRLENKMAYRYPGVGGESYLDVIARLKPLITELERTTNHILIITHRVVARVLIAYFLNLNKNSVGDLDVPLHTIYMFEPKPFGVDYHIYEFDENTNWFNELDPKNLQNSKRMRQVGISFRERAYSVVPTAPRKRQTLFSGDDNINELSKTVNSQNTVSSSSSITSQQLGSKTNNRTNKTILDNINSARGLGQAPSNCL
ncbi:hypothetical protein KL938_002930 [Ogataea parapolymorpha]|nr:hypothetical protein KL938_002930 [Ogataea parapolymorpha]